MKNGAKQQCELGTWRFEWEGGSEPLPSDVFNILVM